VARLYLESPGPPPPEVRVILHNCGWHYRDGRWRRTSSTAPDDEVIEYLTRTLERAGASTVEDCEGDYGWEE